MQLVLPSPALQDVIEGFGYPGEVFDETPEESGHPDETPDGRIVLRRGKFSDGFQVGITRFHPVG